MSLYIKKLAQPLLFPTVLSGICLIVALVGQSLAEVLRFDADAISNGEIWRLVTPHFVHLTWSHFAMNLVGLYLVFIFFGKCVEWKYWLTTFVVSALGTSLLIYWLNTDIRWYVGLSGVLHAMFLMGGIADILVRKWEGIVFTLLLIAKISYEQLLGPLPGSEQAAGGPVLVDAHFYGAIIGGIMGVIYLVRRKKVT